MKSKIIFPLFGVALLVGCTRNVRVVEQELQPVPVYMKGANGVEEEVPVYMTSKTGGWEQVNVYMLGDKRVTTRNTADEIYPGKPVSLTNVHVQKVDSDFGFWVGPTESQVTPVVLNREKLDIDPERRVEVREGQTLQISGIWRRTEDDVNDLKLTPSQQDEFLGRSYYVSADRVTGAINAE